MIGGQMRLWLYQRADRTLIPIAATAKAVEELLKKVDELNVEI